MFAKINHMAMISPNYPMLGKFYEAVFGLKTSGRTSPLGSVVYGDGYVGLNILPKRDGYVGGRPSPDVAPGFVWDLDRGYFGDYFERTVWPLLSVTCMCSPDSSTACTPKPTCKA